MSWWTLQLAASLASSPRRGGLHDAQRVFNPDFFDGGLVMDPRWLILIAAVLTIGLSASWVIRFIKMRHMRSAPLLVFHRVASELGLGLPDQWLLHRVSTQQLLPTPLTLLLSPATFDHHVRGFMEASPTARGSTSRLRAIRAKVFG